eukprot:Seg3475.4 transcript_id=Seg3475.4/GoldUCD/mRNA.D3Y31 product="Fibrinogen-like protein A" protein_id=Seg3475.4/GoldUCD/D3Y31
MPLPTLVLTVFCMMMPQEGWIMVQGRDKEIDQAAVAHVVKAKFQSQYAFKSFHWIGLENLHVLTSTSKPVILRIFLKDVREKRYWAQYSIFKVGDKVQNYTLKVGGYSGNAGDGLSRFNGLPFVTFPHDTSMCMGWWAPPVTTMFDCIFNNLNLKQKALWEELTIIYSYMVIKFREP